jgi:hypothetical protein
MVDRVLQRALRVPLVNRAPLGFGEIQENAGVVLAGSLPCPGRVVPCFLLPQALAVLELRRLALDNVPIITDN